MTRAEMNATFKAHNLRWTKVETHCGWTHPKDLNPQDWILVDADSNIVALGDGKTRENFAKKPTLAEFNERIARMGIRPGDERYAELKASVMDVEINYPSPEAVFEKLQNGEAIERFPSTIPDDEIEKVGRLMGEGKL